MGRLKAIWNKTQTKYDETILKEETKKILTNAKSKSEDVAIVISFRMNLDTMVFEFQKIAYELAFVNFGVKYLESNTATLMRKSIMGQDKSVPIHGQIPLAEDHLSPLFPRNDHHYILMIEENCYFKIFGISGIIQFDDSGTFHFPQGKELLYEFDPVTKTHTKMLFVDYLLELGAFGA